MDDTQIVNLLFDRSERALSELADKYGALCMGVAMNVLESKEDAEECVNSAFLGVWNSIPPARPTSLLAFVSRIVRNKAISRLRRNNADKRCNYTLCIEELEDRIPSAETVEDGVNIQQLTDYINEFLEGLSKTNRIIFIRRFWFMDDYRDIARLTGLREGAVRTRLSRMKNELKKHLLTKGVSV